MRKYKVILHADAEADIQSSFEWGCRTWGRKKAKAWVLDLRRVLLNRLTSAPLSCPLAPEGDELGVSIRHLVIGRYRLLFVVEQRTVEILHVKGSYVDPSKLRD